MKQAKVWFIGEVIRITPSNEKNRASFTVTIKGATGTNLLLYKCTSTTKEIDAFIDRYLELGNRVEAEAEISGQVDLLINTISILSEQEAGK